MPRGVSTADLSTFSSRLAISLFLFTFSLFFQSVRLSTALIGCALYRLCQVIVKRKKNLKRPSNLITITGKTYMQRKPCAGTVNQAIYVQWVTWLSAQGAMACRVPKNKKVPPKKTEL